MSKDPSSLLTKKQREYLNGDYEHDNPANERTMRSRLRKRVYAGLEQDGRLLGELDSEERRKIFRDWENRHYESVPESLKSANHMVTDSLEKGQLKMGIRGLLKFIYLGVEEGNIGDFEDILTDAIDQAERERGRSVENLELNIDFRDLPTLEELYEIFKKGDRSLSVSHIQALYKEGYIDGEDLEEYLDYDGTKGDTMFGPWIMDPRHGEANVDESKIYRESDE